MSWIVDSSVWIEYFNRGTAPTADLLEEGIRRGDVVLGDLIICEVLQGFRSEHEAELAWKRMSTCPVLALGSPFLMQRAARNYRFLRRRGITVRSTIDCIIATFCIEHEFALLTLDRDFEPFAALLGLAFAE